MSKFFFFFLNVDLQLVCGDISVSGRQSVVRPRIRAIYIFVYRSSQLRKLSTGEDNTEESYDTSLYLSFSFCDNLFHTTNDFLSISVLQNFLLYSMS